MASTRDHTQAGPSLPHISMTDLPVNLLHHHPHHPHHHHDSPLAVVAPRSSSLPFNSYMGNASSKTAQSQSQPQPTQSAVSPHKAFPGGINLKRAFSPRRKKSEDATLLFREKDADSRSATGSLGFSAKPHPQIKVEVSPSSASSPPKVLSASSPVSPITNHRGAKQQLSQLASHVFSASKRAAGVAKPTPTSTNTVASPITMTSTATPPASLSRVPSPPPPPPPPKSPSDTAPTMMPPHVRPQVSASLAPGALLQPNRTSIIPLSPGIESAVNYMAISDQLQQQQAAAPLPSVPPSTSPGKIASLSVEPTRSDGTPVTPVIAGKQNDGQQEEEGRERQGEEEVRRVERPRAKSDSEGALAREDKRKSDSTISHATIRLGAGGPRPSRPVSMAESFQSTYTIVPGNGNTTVGGVVVVNKRLSAVEVDLGLLEEDDDSFKSSEEGEGDRRNSVIHIVEREGKVSSPTALKRRSRSLTVGPVTTSAPNKAQVPHSPSGASATELKHPSYSISEGFYSHAASSPSTSNLVATPSSFSPSHAPPDTSLAWGRLHPVRNQTLPPNVSSLATTITYPTQRPLPNHPPPPPSFRQTAVSISNSLAPAAGLARKAVEKVRGALGHMSGGGGGGVGSGSVSTTSISSTSGYSSSTSAGSSGPSAFPGDWGFGLARTSSNQSSGTHSSSMHAVNIKEIKEREKERQRSGGKKEKEKGRTRRTPNAPSGSYSVGSASTTSGSDSDIFMVSRGPVLGVLLRGPMQNRNGAPVVGGVVFGRELCGCVRETGVWVGKCEEADVSSGRNELLNKPELKVYEERMLPTIVVRCAQHLLIWGVQEEGLFRVPGRAAHVAKLRSEFDTGVDYDMSKCTPGDLDPHAVASIFKAYLRELPENILTRELSPYFDAAIEQESMSATATSVPEVGTPSSHSGTRKMMGLPTGQKPNSNILPPSSSAAGFSLPSIRKPPSLSTLAMPSFSGARPPSKNLLSALQSLIGKLPQENKDLLRTVVDLIKATARESRATKMPLSNLLMVFLPSLNVSAQLLRILCEEESLWVGDEVLDVRRDTVVLDIKPVEGTAAAAAAAEKESKAEGDEEEEEEEDAQRRWTIVDRPEVPTIYLDSRSQASSASVASSSHASTFASTSLSRDASTASSSLLPDDVSVSSDGHLPKDGDGEADAILSSSAESVLTPTTSSGHPSLLHFSTSSDTGKEATGKTGELDMTGYGPRIVEAAPLGRGIGVVPGVDASSKAIVDNASNRRSQKPLPVISHLMPIAVENINAPVQFPVMEKQTPTGPKRRSIPALSFPSFSAFTSSNHGSEPGSPSANSTSSNGGGAKALRPKKPSLSLLFSKRSTSSLNGPERVATPGSSGSGKSFVLGPYPPPSPSTPYSIMGMKMANVHGNENSSDSSVSTPLSAVTAPQTGSGVGALELPPVLDTPIDDGPSLRFELGLDLSPPVTATPPLVEKEEEKKKARVKTMVGQTPIADWYKSAANSMVDLPIAQVHDDNDDDDDEMQIENESGGGFAVKRLVPGRGRAISVSSSSSMNHLGLEDDELGTEEDWTRSVLLAAELELTFEGRKV